MTYDKSEFAGWLLAALACGLTVLAHEFTPRHEYHYFADTILMSVGFFIIIYTKDRYYLKSKLFKTLPIRISAAYLALHHVAMFISPGVETVVAAIFLLLLVALWVKDLFGVFIDDD